MGNNNSKNIQYSIEKRENKNYIKFDEEEKEIKQEVIKKNDFIKLDNNHNNDNNDNNYIYKKPIRNTRFNF
tara:strand:+ start:621 stop:833 length:213 start_codon:yes stop_codon:yes gene_type:complete